MKFRQCILSLLGVLGGEAFEIRAAYRTFIQLSIHQGKLSSLNPNLVGFDPAIREFSQAQVVGYWSHPGGTCTFYIVHPTARLRLVMIWRSTVSLVSREAAIAAKASAFLFEPLRICSSFQAVNISS